MVLELFELFLKPSMSLKQQNRRAIFGFKIATINYNPVSMQLHLNKTQKFKKSSISS